VSVIIRGQKGPEVDDLRDTPASAQPTPAETEDPLAGADPESLDFRPIPDEQLAEITQRSHPFA
jgi:hypothetical protein